MVPLRLVAGDAGNSISFRPHACELLARWYQRTLANNGGPLKFTKGRDMISKCANPQCNASLLRLSEGKVFQFEARQIFTLPEGSFLKGHQVAHYWLCRKCLTFMTLGLKDGAVEIKPLQR